MATRKAKIKVEKMTVPAMLRMVAKSTDNGFAVPAPVLLDASNFKTVARMFDGGLIEAEQTAYGIMYWITEAGRAQAAEA